MKDITIHKKRFTLDEVRKALNIEQPIEMIYHSTYGEGYLEFTLGDKV